MLGREDFWEVSIFGWIDHDFRGFKVRVRAGFMLRGGSGMLYMSESPHRDRSATV